MATASSTTGRPATSSATRRPVRLGPAKGKDFATTIGPWIVTPDELADARGPARRARPRDDRRRERHETSRGTWADAHFSFGEMLARPPPTRLRPGDLVGSGTVGGGCLLEVRDATLGRYLEPGDTVTLAIERLGALRTPIVARGVDRRPPRARSDGSPTASTPCVRLLLASRTSRRPRPRAPPDARPARRRRARAPSRPLKSHQDRGARACDRDASGRRSAVRPRLRPRVEDRPARDDQPARCPLYPDGRSEARRRSGRPDDAVEAIHAYAADHAVGFAVYIDRDEHPGVVTSMWTGHLEQHERAISDALGGRLVLHRLVRYGYAELQAITERIKDDSKWMKKIPAKWWGLGVHERENVIILEISSAEPTAVQQIKDHYQLGDQLRVVSDRTGAMLIPGGWVKDRVVRADGKRIGEIDLMLDSTSSVPGHCGGGDIGSASPTTARSSIRVRQAFGRSLSSRRR